MNLNLKKNITLKNACTPYFTSADTIMSSITDYDTFPYPRWYKGVYNSQTPIIDKRQAGYHAMDYKKTLFSNTITCCTNQETPTIEFQIPCSTILPSYSKNKKIVTNCH
jgi:hypothetical protein